MMKLPSWEVYGVIVWYVNSGRIVKGLTVKGKLQQTKTEFSC